MSEISNTVQSRFFEHVRKQFPPHVSFADELSEILKISRDSAYRRIRGETILSLDEVKKLCEALKISLDAIMGPSPEFASFRYSIVDNTRLSFTNWLNTILNNLSMLQGRAQGELFYFAKDLPVFYYFNSPLLSSFKMFFWMNTVSNYDHDPNLKFKPEDVPRDMTSLGKRIYDQYISLARTEIWSEETLNVTLRQIQFYFECGFLDNSAVAVALCDEYLCLLNQIRRWAGTADTRFELYKNDLLIADNTILFRMGAKRIVFIPYNTLNILSTTNEAFCKQTDEYLSSLIRKSEKISTTGEKQRHVFFNKIEEKIKATRNQFH